MGSHSQRWLSMIICVFHLMTILFQSVSVSEDIIISEEVEEVCKQSSSYSFCVESLYSDSRTPQADAYALASISVGLAYVNATSTRHLIYELLNNYNYNYKYKKQPLQRCLGNYKTAISLLAMADNDLNSETFFELPDLAANASRAASDCEAAFHGFPSPPLSTMNNHLKGLCEICGILGNLFTGGGLL